MSVFIKNDDLKQVLKLSKNLLDLRDHRPLCSALRFEFDRGICRVIATNSYRLGVFELPYSGDSVDNFTIPYMPMDFGKGVMDIEISYQKGDNFVLFSTATRSFSIPLANMSYPDWRQVVTIEDDPKYKIAFNRQSLIKTLQSTNDDKVVLNIYGEMKPLVITDTRDKNMRLILPIHI